ncbi:hypothetical protein LINPERHAP1_LOCUS23814, partial [Linum perenne]
VNGDQSERVTSKEQEEDESVQLSRKTVSEESSKWK